MDYALGIDLGGSRVKLATVTSSGEVEEKRSAPVEEKTGGPGSWSAAVADLVEATQVDMGVSARWVGVAAPGLVAEDRLSFLSLPDALVGLEGLEWTEHLGTERTATCLNDAHAALCGEHWLGAAKGADQAVLVHLGAEIGGAFVMDGQLRTGLLGRAGSFGHLCLDPKGERDDAGTPGSLQLALGEATLHARSGGLFKTNRSLMKALGEGDEDAKKVWAAMMESLSCGLVSLINVLDPEIIILSGALAAAGDLLLAPVERRLEELEWRPNDHQVRLVQARLGTHAPAVGAARHAMLNARSRPVAAPAEGGKPASAAAVKSAKATSSSKAAAGV